MRGPSRSSRQAGFTLIEALAGMLLMSIIIATLATVTSQWLPNWRHGLPRVQASQSMAIGLDRLVKDLGSAVWISQGGEKDGPYFEGNSVSLAFVRTALGPNAPVGLELVRVNETSSDTGPTLIRSAAAYATADDPAAGSQFRFARPVVLIRPPYRASFAFLGFDGVWRETWDRKGPLPRAVRILVRDTATSRSLVTTTAWIHTDLPARCVRLNSDPDCPKVASTSMFSAGEVSIGGGRQ